MKRVNVLIKPASSLCNMRCRYCFYADEAANRAQASAGIMPLSTAQTLIRQVYDWAGERGEVTFSFQGGEPTVAGLDFFQQFVRCARELNRQGHQIHYAIQTNGLAVDEEWAAFFARHRFLVGLSIDGDKPLHDGFRLDAQGKGTWNRVVRSLETLNRCRVEVNALCVVTSQCAKSPVRVYQRLKKLGFQYLQFIPCLDPLQGERGAEPYSLTPQRYGEFLCVLFDAWYRDWQQGEYTSIRLFDDYVHLAMGMPPGTCATSGRCGAYLVVEADGSAYPCDFYCLDPWKLGVVGETPFRELWEGDAATRFLQESLERPRECAACQWAPLCRGGCKRDWYQDAQGSHNYLCPAFRRFFAHAAPRIVQIARAVAASQGRRPG